MNTRTQSSPMLSTPKSFTAVALIAALFSSAGCAVSVDEPWDPQGRTDNAINTHAGHGGSAGSGNAGQAGAPTHEGGGGRDTGNGGNAGEGQVGGGAGEAGSGGGGAGEAGSGGGPGEQDVCGNGADDDSDGWVDELCDEDIPCEDTEGNGCNGDLGYGDHCAPEDNDNGCTQDRFWAWCNRRNAAYPDIWDNYLKRWVESRCDGEITLEDPNNDGYETFTCTDFRGHTYTCTTPLVIAFDPSAPVQMSSSEHRFPLQSGVHAAEWPTAATPWLVFDRNANGVIDDGSELFGSGTVLQSGSLARNGFEALSELDSDGNGRIDARDTGWEQLQLWSDRDGDGVSQPGELAAIGASGLVTLELGYFVATRCDGRGNCERERSALSWSDSSGVHAGAVVDVYLRTR